MTADSTETSAETTTQRNQPPSEGNDHQETIVLVRGETVDQRQPQPPKEPQAKDQASPSKNNAPPPLNEVNVKLRERLPALADDAEVGVQKEHVVTRDGKPDLAFAGTLLASAAPAAAPKGEWQEYRIYATSAGKHVFSKVGRNVNAEQEDTYAAEVFDPAPSSTTSKLLKSARDLTHSRELTWTDAAADFFGYDPLAKALYRKLGGQFEEQIS
jgi:hypothetical protein